MPLWQVSAVDLPGHGGSDRSPGRYLVRDYLVELAAFVRQFEEPVVIYGHSLGALLAGAVAAECPDRVRGIIAEDPPSPGFLDRVGESSYRPLFQGMQRLAGAKDDVGTVARRLGEVIVGSADDGTPLGFADVRDAASIRFSARWLCDLDPEVYTPILERRWLEGLEYPALWSRVRCPALLLAADAGAGGMLSAVDARAIMDELRDGTLVSFPQVGHQLHWLAREAVMRAVLAFLTSL
jgi:pimeloyl-ACP methyl ester carboxylesterase